MGVYNPSMKMPENCYLCGYSVCGCVTSNMILHCGVAEPMDFMEAQEHRHKDCPLVEVKEPHGRLIDADALHNIIKQRTKNWAGGWDNLLYALTGNDVLNAPTVLEAE